MGSSEPAERIAANLTERARSYLRGTTSRAHLIIAKRDGRNPLYIIAGTRSHIAHNPVEQALSLKAILELAEAGLIKPAGKDVWKVDELGFAIADLLRGGSDRSDD